MLVDALGLPIKYLLTPRQRNNSTLPARLTAGVHGSSILTDKGCEAEHLTDFRIKTTTLALFLLKEIIPILEITITLITNEGNLIEFFRKIKDFKRVFSSFLDFVGTFI